MKRLKYWQPFYLSKAHIPLKLSNVDFAWFEWQQAVVTSTSSALPSPTYLLGCGVFSKILQMLRALKKLISFIFGVVKVKKKKK